METTNGVPGRVVGCAVAAMALMACGIEAEDTGAVVSAVATNVDCGLWGCGSNAATMAHELDGSGQTPNTEGLAFVSFAMDGDVAFTRQSLRIGVEDTPELAGRLKGITQGGRGVYASELIARHAIITVSDPPAAYSIRIASSDTTPFWFRPDWLAGKTETFVFEYAGSADTEWRPLCSDPTAKPEPRWHRDHDWAWVGKPLAVVFAGDRYKNKSKTLTTDDIGQWFNIACAGSAVAKMHLLRYTTSGSRTIPEPPSSISQRTAVLKMITDDICGTGRSFTIDGEDVLYTDWQGHHTFMDRTPVTPPVTDEAIWTEAGAACLDTPRRLAEDGPGLWQEIDAECGHRPLPCRPDQLAAWQRFGWGYSANP